MLFSFFLRPSGILGFNELGDFVIAIALFLQGLPFIPQLLPSSFS
jgi:hypothetical protein